MNKQKHLTLTSRITIETMLNKGDSFKSIGRFLNKDCTTISKEVKITSALKKAGLMAGHSTTAVSPFCISALLKWYVENVPFAKAGSASPAANVLLPVSSTNSISAPDFPGRPMYATAVRPAINALWKNISIRLPMLKKSMNWSEANPEPVLPSPQRS